MKKTIITVIVIIIVIIGLYFVFHRGSSVTLTPQNSTTSSTTGVNGSGVNQSPTPTTSVSAGPVETIGMSAGGHPIVAYHYGSGSTEVVFVGGIHGGYEWNTVLVAGQLMKYLAANPSAVPANERITVIPVLNPDGLGKVVGTSTVNFTAADVSKSNATVISGRYNSDNVDLNRNFDCDWQATGVWQNTPVSGGSAAFSEPESQAMQKYITTNKPTAVVVWYSAAGGVYASNCHGGVSDATNNLTQTFATASGYSAHQSFDFYATTGDMTNWLAKIGVPAISVLLTDHTGTEWSKNLAGIQAVLTYYAK